MNYLISGIGPGSSGVGRLMKALIPEYTKRGYQVIFKRDEKSVREFLKEKKYFFALMEPISRLYAKFHYYLKMKVITHSNIILLHPQTVGFDVLINLVYKNNVSLYLMDNSFFCIRSYNMNPESHLECFHCVNNIDPLETCNPFPVRISKNKNIFFLQEIKKISKRITFLAQNRLQAELVKRHFGEDVALKIIGMDTKEFSFVSHLEKNYKSDIGYDVVYHGAPILEKGISYVIDLAKQLPTYTFLIPSSEVSVKSIINQDLPDNISCKDITWEQGLKEIIISAKLVINPSLWSACIEGALLKSAYFNDNVATVKTEYGYENEITTIKNHLRLDKNPILAANDIKLFFEKVHSLNKNH